MTKDRTITKQYYQLFTDQIEDLKFYSFHESFKQCRTVTPSELVRAALDEYIDKLKQKGV